MASVVQSPRRVQHVNDVVTQLERGDLRLRVRVLESEAAFARLEATQGSLTAAVMATLLLNAGTVLASSATAGPAVLGSRSLYLLAGFFGLQVPVGYLKVCWDKEPRSIYDADAAVYSRWLSRCAIYHITSYRTRCIVLSLRYITYIVP